MRETIIRCNHCGKIIEGDPYKVFMEQIDRETGDYSVQKKADCNKVEKLDWCENCFHNLTELLLDTNHHLFVNPPMEEDA